MKDYLSACCKAPVKTSISPDFIGDNPNTMTVGTCCFVCSMCEKPCDVREPKELKNLGWYGK